MQKMNNLTQRILTGIVGAAVLITGMVWNVYSLIIVLYLLSLLIHVEYLRTVQNIKGGKLNLPELYLNVLTGLIVFSIAPLLLLNKNAVEYSAILLLPVFSLFFIYELFAKRENPFQQIGLNILGIFYCVIPFALLLLITNTLKLELEEENPAQRNEAYFFILGYFLIVWTHDSMSYFAGRSFGKHKLFERISPKKTWEGFIGGLVFSIGAAYLISMYLNFLEANHWIIIAIIISVFGTLGDLVESMLKRSMQLKDSSSILPGHGGFLDRFDATLIAAPFVWLYVVILQM